ncbi:MAG: vanadium-dependent haloperoxidase [Leptolyngbya sp. RL_3_1]|nr:vanadium-dependent haloperoxidase [Leptolyngbya sp. RL_3_1]
MNSPEAVVDLNRWQPLATPNGNFQGGCIDDGSVIVQTFIGPHWGNVVPFALADGDAIAPASEPATYPSEAFTQQALDIVNVSANLTEPQKAMAEYWADGPSSEFPPGHWALFGQVVSLRDHHSLDDDAKLFFALSNANLDAGILAWGVKRDYDSVRPITAIQALFRGQRIRAWAGPYQGTQWINGEDWMPYQAACFVSPAFAEFVSGHSTFSAASAEVLATFTGSDAFGYSDVFEYSEVEYIHKPVELTWATFSEAADEAGMSRRYGGIHFAPGDLVGRELGREVGRRVWEKSEAFLARSHRPRSRSDGTTGAVHCHR